MEDSATPMERQRLEHRQRMRIRTIVVSFSAAVSSTQRDLEVAPAERDALVETWRAWSLGVLERYGREIDELYDATHPAAADELAALRSTVAAALQRVRDA